MKFEIKKSWKIWLAVGILIAGIICMEYLLQRFWVHGKESFRPEYPQEELSAATETDTFFLQTGIGPIATKKLLQEGKLQTLQEAQTIFFNPNRVVCDSLIGWFTREDKLQFGPNASEKEGEFAVMGLAESVWTQGPQFVDLQPGDILITLSTHSVGWRHGHAALVLDEKTTVESVMWGVDSTYGRVENWLDYSNWAVLRVKEVTPQLQQQVADFAENELCGVPYHVTAGFIGTKAPKTNAPYFGVHCTYLVWYAWNQFGYDLDSDGGRLVTAYDLLHAEQVEVVQLYGMDPRDFME